MYGKASHYKVWVTGYHEKYVVICYAVIIKVIKSVHCGSNVITRIHQRPLVESRSDRKFWVFA